ncbi:MAG: class I adenylate-forming enzyme family protein, partial [Syntrophomonadaceae bacterium]|nr:class I adenylate-forming enzyme family protein [Syntrophomonadaceae bacterium]
MNITENAFRLLSDYLIKNAHDYPNKTALVYNNQRISYKEFSRKSEVLAKYLLKIGVKRQDRIAYLLETQPEFFYLCMAAARIGAIIVGMGTKLMPPELEYIIKNSDANYIFVAGGDKPYLDRLAKIIDNCTEINQVFVVGEKIKAPNVTTFEDIFQEEYSDFDNTLAEREAQVNTDDGLLMVYTSGTTGHPKGALLPHRNIIHSSLMEANEFGSTSDDVWLDNMPINHVGGAIVQGITPLLTASTIVLLANFSPMKTLDLIQTEKVTILGGVPTMYAMEFNLPDYDEYDKSSLRLVHFGGSMPPKNTLERVFLTMTTNVYNCLGMTEVAGIITYTPKGSNVDLLSKTLGKVIPGIEWKLVDNDRKTVQQGEAGEIAFRGSTIIKEYYKLPQATDESIDEDGWFYAGDMFCEDDNGLLILMGRKKEMFITGGENVYTAEVEGVISSYDKVETVALVPAPDPIYGDIGYAYIIPKSGCTINEADLKAYLKKRLAAYKIPKKFIIRFILPVNPVGKIDKKVLAEEIAKE